MDTSKKSKRQIADELEALRARIAELEQVKVEHAQTEEASQEALCKWTHIFEHAGWGIVVGSADGKTIEMMNPAFASMHGYTVEELSGRSLTDVFAPESRAELPAQLEIAHEQGHYDFEATNIRKDGSTFPVVVHVTAVKDKAGRVRCRAVHVEDITERKREEAMSRTQRRLVILLGLTTDLSEGLGYLVEATCQIEGIDCASVFLVDRQTGAFDLVSHRGLSAEYIKRSFHFNAGTELARLAMAGWSILWSAQDTVPEEQEALRRSEGLQALAMIPVLHGGRVVAMLNPGSRTRDSFDASVRHVLGAIAAQIGDIIGRTRTEDLLRESQSNLQSVLGAVDNFLFILDEEGEILRVNPALRRRLGYYEKELIGASVFKVHPPDRQEELRAIIADILAEKATLCSIPLMAKDGSLIPVETRIVWGKWDNHDALIGFSKDMTGCAQAEEALRQARTDLQVCNEALDDFGQVVGRDLKKYLDNIISTASSLEDGKDTLSPKGVKEMARKIERMGLKMDDIIEELMQMDRP